MQRWWFAASASVVVLLRRERVAVFNGCTSAGGGLVGWKISRGAESRVIALLLIVEECQAASAASSSSSSSVHFNYSTRRPPITAPSSLYTNM